MNTDNCQMSLDHIGFSVGAFVIDTDGHNVEAECHAPEA